MANFSFLRRFDELEDWIIELSVVLNEVVQRPKLRQISVLVGRTESLVGGLWRMTD